MPTPRSAGHEVVEKLKAKPVSAGRYDIVVDPSQLFLCIHESVGHSTELDRALGWEANMAGTSFIKPADAGTLRFGSKIVNLVGDRTQPDGLATTGFDDEGVKADRWHIVRDGMFVDWQTTRELAPLVGQKRSHGCLHPTTGRACRFRECRTSHWNRLPLRSRSMTCSATSSADCSSSDAACLDRSAALQLPVRRRVIREITNGKLGAMVRDAVYQSSTPEFWASCDGIGGRSTYRLWGTSADGKGEPGQTNAVSHGCPPARFRQVTVLNTAAHLMLTREEALRSAENLLSHAKAAGAEDAIVTLNSSVESHARFADNRITTSGRVKISISPRPSG